MKRILLFLGLLMTLTIFSGKAQVTAFSENFESGFPSGWTVLDADGDGATWTYATLDNDPCYGGHNYSDGYMFSFDAANIDNWLVTSQITLGASATLTFWRCSMFAQYAEHYGVYVSTTTNDPSAFTLVFEETIASGQYGWRERTVDLSNYEGNTVYIAFRHFNSNVYILGLDDITLTMSTLNATILATPSQLNFGEVPAGSPAPKQEVTVTAFNVTGGITASTNAPFEVSTDNIVYTNSVVLPDSGGILYVHYFPLTASNDSTSLTLTGSSTTITIPLTGESMDCSGAVSLPYLQNFDDTPINSIPDCWYQINPYEGHPKVTTNHAYSGNSLRILSHDNTGDPNFAVMPQMPQDITNLQLSFWGACQGIYSGTLTVGYVTDPSDSSTFVPVWSKSYSEIGDTQYHPFLISFANVTTTSPNNYIAFKHQSTTGWAWLIDEVVVDVIGACGAPTELTVNQVTGTTATLSWAGSASSYVVYYRPTADTAWTVIQNVTLDSTGYTLTNLLPTTPYTWRVASVCDDGSLVNSIQSSTFTTLCSFFTAPFSENFNAQGTFPNCWERMTGSASNAFAGTNPTSYSGGWVMATVPFGNYHPKINIFGINTKHWLVTPAIDLSPLSNPALTFDLALTDYFNADPIENPTAQADDKFMVIISTDNGATWSAANAIVWSDSAGVGNYPYSEIATAGQEITISLAAYANQTVRIAFYGESTVSGGDNDLHIDNVLVDEAPACPKPTGVSVDSISHNYAVISWSSGNGISSWTIEYQEANATSWNDLTTTDTSVTLTGLAATTNYIVRIYADCGNGESSQPTVINFTTNMAAQSLPYSTDFSSSADQNWVLDNGDRPNYWTIGTLGSESALFITNNGTTAGYTPNGAFSIVTAEKLFSIGESPEIKISFDVKVGGEGTFDYLKVFFTPADVNYPSSHMFVNYADYDFGAYSLTFPTSVSPYPYMINLTGNNIVHVEVNTPNPNDNPTANSTGKLVFLWKNDQSDGTNPGAIIYNVSLESVSCFAPTDLTVSNITTTSAEIGWTPTGNEDTWRLEYKESSDADWAYVMVSNSPTFFLTGLTPGSDYQVRVQSVCSNDGQSIWLTGSFSTPCEAITTFPYTEDFENDGLKPDCWSQEYIMGALDWSYQAGANSASGITTAHSGNYNAFFYQASNTGNTTRLVSPIFDLSNMTNIYLTYWYAQKAWGNDQDHLVVYYRTSPSANWQTLAQHHTSVSEWTLDSLMLPNPSATYQLAFEGLANYGYGIVLDDITINGTIDTTVVPDPCETPTNLVATEVTTNSITFDWTDHSDAYSWNVAWTWGSTLAGPIPTSNKPYTMANLQPNTTYTIRVQTICTGIGESEWSEPLTVTTLGVGIDDYLTNSISLYPNPANDVVNVQCTMNNVQVEAVEVFDVYGKLLQTVSMTPETTRINVSGLAAGIYFVRVTTNEGNVTKSFVKK